jgi:hypothetical protein
LAGEGEKSGGRDDIRLQHLGTFEVLVGPVIAKTFGPKTEHP